MVFIAATIIAVSTPPPERRLPRAGAPAPTDFLSRIRARAARSIDLTFGDDAPMARALLIADQRQIPTEMRDRYAAAGLVHMLSISGLHVAIIAAAMELLFQVARMSRRASLLGAFVATGAYVAVIGAPAPALRSAAMLGVTMASRMAHGDIAVGGLGNGASCHSGADDARRRLPAQPESRPVPSWRRDRCAPTSSRAARLAGREECRAELRLLGLRGNRSAVS